MKTFLTTTALSFALLITIPGTSWAASGKIDFREISRVVASAQFTQALATASGKINGYKIRMTYETNNASRTTTETVKVTLVGKIESQNDQPDTFQQAEFKAIGMNGGWQVRVSEVKFTAITANEFASFEE